MMIATCAFNRRSILHNGSSRGIFHSKSWCCRTRSTAFYGMLPGYEPTKQPRVSWPALSESRETEGGFNDARAVWRVCAVPQKDGYGVNCSRQKRGAGTQI